MGWVKHLWGAVAGFVLALLFFQRRRLTLSQSAVDLAVQDKKIAEKEAADKSADATDWARRHIDQVDKEAADEIERDTLTGDLAGYIARKNRERERNR